MIPRFIKKTPKAKRVRPIMANKSVIEEKEPETTLAVEYNVIIPRSIDHIETTFVVGQEFPTETAVSETEVSQEKEAPKKPVKKANKKKTTKQDNTNPEEIITEETKTEE